MPWLEFETRKAIGDVNARWFLGYSWLVVMLIVGIAHLIVDVEILSQRITSRHEGAVVDGHRHLEDRCAEASLFAL